MTTSFNHLRERCRDLRVAITGGTSGLGLALVREFRARVERVIREVDGAHGVVAPSSMRSSPERLKPARAITTSCGHSPTSAHCAG